MKALRSALAAIDNAEAVDHSFAPRAEPGLIAGGVRGLGQGEVPRRELTDDDVRTIVNNVIEERHAAAVHYDELGRTDDADGIRSEIAVLARVVSE